MTKYARSRVATSFNFPKYLRTQEKFGKVWLPGTKNSLEEKLSVIPWILKADIQKIVILEMCTAAGTQTGILNLWLSCYFNLSQ